MKRGLWRLGLPALTALLAWFTLVAPFTAVVRGEPKQGRPPRLANRGNGNDLQPREHPLDQVIRQAQNRLNILQGFNDYACTFIKRGQINGQMSEYQHMEVKVRRQPFSVYMKFVEPAEKRGQEVLYVKGANGGKLLAHGVGLKAVLGTIALDPNGKLAMEGNRHPITEFGLEHLNQRIIARSTEDRKFGECEVKYRKGAKVEGRPCSITEIWHPQPRLQFKYNLVRVFVDDEHGLPVRYETYEWPAKAGDLPVLLEEYTFKDLQFNNGFQDIDFDVKNPAYDF